MNNHLQALQINNFWGTLRYREIGYPRKEYLPGLLDQMNAPEVGAVIGVRRSGKSTTLKQLLWEITKTGVPKQNTLYFNAEESSFAPRLGIPFMQDMLKAYEKTVAKGGKKYIILDEIQNIVGWESLVRTLVDTRRDLKIYITGSSAKLLSAELSTKLSGRFLTTEMFPLGWREYRSFSKRQGKKVNVLDYLVQGGFPRVVLEQNSSVREQLLEDYFNSILLRDIAQRYSIRNITELKDLAVYLYSNNSKLSSIPRFTKLLSLSPDTVRRFFEYIQNAYMGFFVPQFAYSLKKQIYNPKKFYAIDTGLQRSISFQSLDNNGKLLENIVFLEIRRKYRDIYYWQGKQEVDFVVKQGTVVRLLINVAYSIQDKATFDREVNGLKEAMLELEKDEGIIVTLEENKTVNAEVGRIRVMSMKSFVRMLAAD